MKHAWVDGVPKGWETVGPAPLEQRLTVRIGLRQDGVDDLIEHLYAVSDPSHQRYEAKSPGYTICRYTNHCHLATVST